MASVVTALPPETAVASPPVSIPEISETSASTAVHAVAARQEIRMGRAASIGQGINWLTFGVIVAFHLGAIAALFFFSWQRLAAMVVLYILAINVGIGMCYHRLLTHRVHHQLSDHDGDPHTPREGGWWAHTGWLVWGKSLHAQTAVLARYVPDLARDRFHVWLSKYHWLPVSASGVLLFSLGWWTGGWKNAVGMLLWGGFLRITLGLHATWLVNSATHLWGSRRFETRDDSRNSWWVALFSGGEGWHNNHHAHPVSAKHGLAWYEYDPNYWGIWLLKKVGLARKVQVAKYDKADPKPAGLQAQGRFSL